MAIGSSSAAPWTVGLAAATQNSPGHKAASSAARPYWAAWEIGKAEPACQEPLSQIQKPEEQPPELEEEQVPPRRGLQQEAQ